MSTRRLLMRHSSRRIQVAGVERSDPPARWGLPSLVPSHAGRTAFALAFVAATVGTFGCKRAHYRRQADQEVTCIIDHKSMAVGSAPGQFRIEVDPRSRMYDPYNPDCPPMPPDDPVSHRLMQCVDCKPGSPCWQHMGKTCHVENPVWLNYLPRDEDGNVVLDQTGAVQLALLQSPDYQQQLENLYLSGLDVTFERFRFDTQFFGNSSIFYTAEGPVRAGRPAGSSLLEVQPFNFEARKLTATGGELVVGFANSLMWQFAGPDDYSSLTILDFNLLQPLLRFGGRIRVLERLTIAERALLANVRQMEHYRRGFYLNVVSGREPGQGPSRRGGFFGGTGLEGFAGVGGGGFGRVGGFGGAGLGGFFGTTGGAGAQQAGGYIGLLQTAQVIQNQYANIAGLGDSLEQLQAAHEAGRIDRFQVDLARQAMYNAQSQLLNSEAIYESSLDNFKVQHGLPPDLPVKISDPMLDQFNLLDSELAALQIRVTNVLTVMREGVQAAQTGRDPAEPLVIPKSPPPEIEMKVIGSDLASLLQQSRELVSDSEERFAAAAADLQRFEQAIPSRSSTLRQLAQREEAQQLELDPDLLSPERLADRHTALRQELVALGQRLAAVSARLDSLAGDTALPAEQLQRQYASALTELSGALMELSLLQARARLDAITFEPVDLTSEEAFCIASRYRRDWMNARAALVDSWRLIHFNANALQSDLNLIFSGDIRNVGDNPFDLRASNGRLRVGLEFDAPLTRLSERNVYRQSLIEYQQARRSYYQFRDRLHRNVRATLRQLQLDELNFELRRAAVHVAITQVDLARLRLSEPARPVTTAPGQAIQPAAQAQFGATVARDLVNAQIDLLNVQNDFLSVWVDHHVQLLNLDFELGIMELDPRGIRLPHDQPLKMYLTALPCTAPCECPDPCAHPGVSPFEVLPMQNGAELLPEPQSLQPSGANGEMLPRPSPPAEQRPDAPSPKLLPPPTSVRELPTLEP